MTSNSHLLIVDNQLSSVERLHGCLAGKGFVLEVVQDGVDAWEKLAAAPDSFDAIILGRMPPQQLNGVKLLRRIKDDPVMQSIPVILRTGRASTDEILEGIRAGALYYLTEPFERELLISVLETAAADRMRYRRLQDAHAMAGRTFDLLGEGNFFFRTLEDARDLATMLAGACPDPARAVIGLSELLVNAVEHGNLGISYEQKGLLLEERSWEKEIARRLRDPRYAKRQVEVRYRRDSFTVEVLISDEGDGFDWQSYMEMSPERAFDNHGRGIAMSRALSFDTMEYRGNGNEVAVRIRLDPASRSSGFRRDP